MPVLILSPRYTADSNALWKAAIQAGWQVERLQTRQPSSYLKDMNPVLYGEGLFIAVIVEVLELAPLEPTFCWLTELSEHYRKREIQCTTLKMARAQKMPAFIKPAVGKSFDAKIYLSGSDLPIQDVFSEDMPVLISEPVAWEIEFRCFICERNLITYSPYLRTGQFLEDSGWAATPDEIAGATEFCKLLLSDISVMLPPAIVIDIGYITNRGWAVVEANPAWASGLYGCDPSLVLGVLEKAVVPLGALTDRDKHWVVDKTDT